MTSLIPDFILHPELHPGVGPGRNPNRSIAGAFSAVESSAIHVEQMRCAKTRNRNVQCLKCADACTSGCISLDDDGRLVVDAGKCVGCGTCATVCPTCALEARNPTDAELLHECLDAMWHGEVTIACAPAAEALEGVLEPGSVARVVCCGRVEESLLLGLAAQDVRRVHVVCGECGRCAQVHGAKTFAMVRESTEDLLAAWGCVMGIDGELTEGVLADGVTLAQAREALREHFERAERGNTPLADGRGTFRQGIGPTTEPPADERRRRVTNPQSKRLTDGRPAGAGEDTERFADPAVELHASESTAVYRVMRDGTLPHFVPDRRERLLDALVALGAPRSQRIESRLWGCVVIDGMRCESCQMCATFCPTGAICKFADEDGSFGVTHHPGDCVKCGSCRDICPAGAIQILDSVPVSYVLDGTVHRYRMKERPVKLDDPHQIKNTMQQYIDIPIYER